MNFEGVSRPGRFRNSGVESALEDGDTGTAANGIRSFKGVAGNMRLDDCYNAVVSVESALRAKDCAEALKRLPSMRSCVD